MLSKPLRGSVNVVSYENSKLFVMIDITETSAVYTLVNMHKSLSSSYVTE